MHIPVQLQLSRSETRILRSSKNYSLKNLQIFSGFGTHDRKLQKHNRPTVAFTIN